jgi:putative methyltransferase (TIGR04325 family)
MEISFFRLSFYKTKTKNLYKHFKLKIFTFFFTQRYFKKVYNNWGSAELDSTGYNSDIILEKCKIAQLKVIRGEARYERDSVIFHESSFHWQLLATIQFLAIENSDQITILDFGGSLGSLFFQNRSMLNLKNKINWLIVEQDNFVKCGNDFFSNTELSFFNSVESAIEFKNPDLIILSSVLQYIEHPQELIGKLLSSNPKYIIIDRTPNSLIDNDYITVQEVPTYIYPASYPCWIFSKKKLISYFSDFSLISEFNSNITDNIYFNNDIINWNGFLLKKID